ncbi:hypothetical protein [Rudaea sp.]
MNTASAITVPCWGRARRQADVGDRLFATHASQPSPLGAIAEVWR